MILLCCGIVFVSLTKFGGTEADTANFALIHISVVCCGRAIPLLWRVLEHSSATVAFKEYEPMLRKARWLLRHHPDVMMLADRGFANHDFLSWLQASNWYYCIRITSDTKLHGIRRHPIEASSIYPKKGEAAFYAKLCHGDTPRWQDFAIMLDYGKTV